MRLFLGIDLPEEVKCYLFELQSGLKNSSLAKVNWDAKKKFHITLKFLGDISDDKIEEIKNKLMNIKFCKFKLKLSTLGYFPGGSKINVIWIGVTPEDKVIELQKLIDYETIAFGDLKFSSPHITLGRVKFLKHKRSFLDKIKNIKVENISFEADSFILYKSTLTKDGSIYGVLERYNLI